MDTFVVCSLLYFPLICCGVFLWAKYAKKTAKKQNGSYCTRVRIEFILENAIILFRGERQLTQNGIF